MNQHPETELFRTIYESFTHDPVRSQRLFLRPFTETDFEDFYAFVSDGEFLRLTGIPPVSGREDAKARFEKILAACPVRDYAVVYEQTGGVIGFLTTAYHPFLREDSALRGKKGVSLSFGLHPCYRGQGLMTELLYATFDRLLGILCFDFVNSGCFSFNEASLRLHRKVGMRPYIEHEYRSGETVRTVQEFLLEKESADLRTLLHPIPPTYDENSEVLLLGSFPSARSRLQGYYYGHPRNRFWQVLAGVCGKELPESVGAKKTFLLQNRLALWDVVYSCRIRGSADDTIRDVRPNDLRPLLEQAKIRRICTCGKTATDLYARYLQEQTGIPAVYLPSTSPANAAWTLERLIDVYAQALR